MSYKPLSITAVAAAIIVTATLPAIACCTLDTGDWGLNGIAVNGKAVRSLAAEPGKSDGTGIISAEGGKLIAYNGGAGDWGYNAVEPKGISIESATVSAEGSKIVVTDRVARGGGGGWGCRICDVGNGLEVNGLRANGFRWNGLHWNGLHWNGLHWNGLHWNGLHWNGIRLNSGMADIGSPDLSANTIAKTGTITVVGGKLVLRAD